LLHEFIKVVGPSVGKVALVVSPDELVGVELRGIRGKAVDVQARIVVQKLLDVLASVDGGPIPQEHNGPRDVAQEVAKENGDLDLGDVLRVKVKIKTQALSTRADRNRGDGRDLGVPKPMRHEGGLSPGCPGSLEIGDQEEASLVQESQVRLQTCDFFLMAIHP
jgi:hypothetical protein